MEGPTPSGGAYAIAYFSDAHGRPAEKSQAGNVEIHEFDAAGAEHRPHLRARLPERRACSFRAGPSPTTAW